MPIRVLDKKVVAQIAAGEVVERPASVVKELVENALDAGATQIVVEAKGGGVSLIRVTDNGSGIPADEVELAFERHATSKISSVADLQSIHSLGFRGEALPSIAAVAQVEMVTCAVGEATGTFVSLEGGVMVQRRTQARAPGTTVAVRQLFRNVPARLKFLKSAATENNHIAGVVSQYAFAYPEVAFMLMIDGRKTLSTSGRGRLMDSIMEIYGLETARQMLEVKSDGWSGPVEVSGMVGAPTLSRAGRDYLSFFVNRRWVNSRLLTRAVEEAYHGLLTVGKHPVAVIALSLPPPEVDVNIHPAKSEVKFHNERTVFMAVQKAVRQALVEQMPVPSIGEVATAPYAPPVQREQEIWNRVAVSGRSPQPAVDTFLPLTASLPVLRVIGQLMKSYIVAEGPDGLYLIDQHAAHERIILEQVKAQRARQAVEVQGLLAPATLEVSPAEAQVMKWHLTELASFGFTLEPFGERTYLVRAVPAVLGNGDWLSALRELLDAGNDKASWTEKVLISLACHGAVRSGKALTDDEMRALVRQLEQTAAPHTCPHGRPTLIRLSAGQLSREFRRT